MLAQPPTALPRTTHTIPRWVGGIAAARKSAAPSWRVKWQAKSSILNLIKSDNRPPAALAGPLDFHSTFCRPLPPSYVFYGISCLGGAQNSNSGRIRAQILETLCKLRSPGAQNSKSGHLRAQILDASCKLSQQRNLTALPAFNGL